MRPIFGREYIEDEFQRIGEGLSEPLTVYLIGGGAMSLHDLKGSTKDIDLVVPLPVQDDRQPRRRYRGHEYARTGWPRLWCHPG